MLINYNFGFLQNISTDLIFERNVSLKMNAHDHAIIHQESFVSLVASET